MNLGKYLYELKPNNHVKAQGVKQKGCTLGKRVEGRSKRKETGL